jgi:hypothetical protein
MWTVVSVTGRSEALDSAEKFGNTFKVTILVEHRPSPAAAVASQPVLEEPPTLEWDEQIFARDHAKKSYWHWSGDVYANKSTSSRTFSAWRARYYEAYNTARRQSTRDTDLRGKVELEYPDGEPVLFLHRSGDSIPQTNGEKTEFVRRFIARNACRLRVEIHDVPAIHVSPHQANWSEVDKERLLLFDCGLGNARVRASQYLHVKASWNRTLWQRRFQMGWMYRALAQGDYMLEHTPSLYTLSYQPLLAGEYE